MNVLLFNAGWMTWNLILAFTAVLFAYLALETKKLPVKLLLFGLAVLFAPNTLYITTDLTHLFRQLPNITTFYQPILLFQYLIFVPLGITTFFITLKELERVLTQFLHHKVKDLTIVFLNYLIAFGVVIGRVQRANSWYVFTQPFTVLNNILKTILSVELMVYVLTLGVFANLIYFSLRKRFGVGERT